MAQQDSRIRIKRSTTTTTEPSVPSSSDHTDGTWTATDLYIGELFLNTADDRLWVRTANGVKEIPVGGGDIKSKTVTLSSAQILDSYSTPIEAVAAVTGKKIQVISALCDYTYLTSPYATYTNLILIAETASTGQLRIDISGTSSRIGSFTSEGANDNIVTGDALMLAADSGNPTGGLGSMVINILYRLV